MKAGNKFVCCLGGTRMEIAEENNAFLTLVNRVCYYNHPNLNGTMLPYPDDEEGRAEVLKIAQTLVDMPVQGKYAVNAQGKPTFRGHEMRRTADGDYVFGTQSIGTHTEVWIAEDDVVLEDGEKHRLPCLFARQKIWKRYKNYVEAVKRLFSEGKLYNSWEIESSAYEYRDGIKILEDYTFIGNAFLGWDLGFEPAYGPSAEVLSVAGRENTVELMAAEALGKDLDEAESEAKRTMKDNADLSDVSVQAEDEAARIQAGADPDIADAGEASVADGASAPGGDAAAGADVSMLTTDDLLRKLHEKLREHFGGDEYNWVAFLFPNDNIAWVKTAEDRKAGELAFTEVAYAVADDEVTILSTTPVKLEVSPREVNDMAERLRKAESDMKQMKADNDALRANIEKLEAEKKIRDRAERDAQIANLRAWAEKSGCFTDEELADSGAAGTLINKLCDVELKALATDRLLAREAERAAHEAAQAERPRAILETNVSTRSASWKKFLND